MIIKLNDEEKWQELFGKSSQDLRSNDIEVILRFFALLQDGDQYYPKIISFLNDFSIKSKSFKVEHIEYLQKIFLSFINACSELGIKAFFQKQ